MIDIVVNHRRILWLLAAGLVLWAGCSAPTGDPSTSCEDADAIVEVPDPQLAAALRGALGQQAITCVAMRRLTELEAPSLGITSLQGLQQAVNLRRLALGDNRVADASPLSGLVKLEELGLGGNRLRDLSPLEGLAGLRYLDLCCQELLVHIDALAELRGLEYLGLHYNRIVDIAPLAANPGLGAGNFVQVYENMLYLAPGTGARRNLDALLARGVDVVFDPQREQAAGSWDYYRPVWQPREPGIAPHGKCCALDLNGDGALDIAIPTWWLPDNSTMTTWLNDGRGDLTLAFDAGAATLEWPRYLAMADFNGDGLLDLFVADHGFEPPIVDTFYGGQSRIYIQQPDGGLREETGLRLPAQTGFAHHVSVGDIDGDGDVDIFLVNMFHCECSHQEPRFWLNDGNGFFTDASDRLPAAVANLDVQYGSSALADLDGDGDLDLVLGGNLGEAHDRILWNDGSGFFTYAPIDALPPRFGGPDWVTWDIGVADFDGDGLLDLAMGVSRVGTVPETAYVQLLYNNGDGTFRDMTDAIPQVWEQLDPASPVGFIDSVRPFDLNDDGWMDLVVSTVNLGTKLFFNVRGERFVDGSHLIPNLDAFQAIPGDFDGDGRTDLFLAGGSWAFIAINIRPFEPE